MSLDNAHGAYSAKQPLIPESRGAEWAPRSHWQASRGVDFSAPTAPPAESVRVYVNCGRWIAECPDCRGAQVACHTDRRFMCHCCGNAAVGGRWRATVWPPAAFLAGVESALAARPSVNAHWAPGETLAQLVAENAEFLPVGVK